MSPLRLRSWAELPEIRITKTFVLRSTVAGAQKLLKEHDVGEGGTFVPSVSACIPFALMTKAHD